MRIQISKRMILWLAMLAWMALIFWFSSAGHEVSSGQSTGVVYAVQDATGVTLPEILVRKIAHITLYGVLGVLICLLVLQYTQLAHGVVGERGNGGAVRNH